MKKLFLPILRRRKNKNDLFFQSTIVERTKETYITLSTADEMKNKTYFFHLMS
jgi:hypothetical protein